MRLRPEADILLVESGPAKQADAEIRCLVHVNLERVRGSRGDNGARTVTAEKSAHSERRITGNDLVFDYSHLFHRTYRIIKGLPRFLGGQEAQPVHRGWLQCILRQQAPKSYAKSDDMRIFLHIRLDFYCISRREMI